MTADSYTFEHISFIPSPLNNGEFIPKIAVGTEDIRPFAPEDMHRVLDYDNMPDPPPPDAPHGHLEFEMDDDATVSDPDDAPPKFPKRYFCLRGSFIFYFDMEDVEGGLTPSYNGGMAKFNEEPLGVIPLERTVVEFPQGGRRVFREHAKSEARGYEMMIRHNPRAGAAGDSGGIGGAPAGTKTKRRAPAYLVCDSLGQRELWANAIRTRAELHKRPTKLRTAGSMANAKAGFVGATAGGLQGQDSSGKKKSNDGLSPSRRVGGDISVLAGVIESGEQKDIDEALELFGSKTLFEEAKWVNDYFETYDQYQGNEMCTKLERWQTSIKKGLRGAVLEQYEYFVEASREMTIMGREVASLKDLGHKQVETFESMQRVNFDLDFGLGNATGDLDGTDNTTEDETTRYSSDEDDNNSDSSSFRRRQRQGNASTTSGMRSKKSGRSGSRKTSSAAIEIPPWLEDVVEEIGSFVNQCRYTDATELLLKAKTEVTEIINSNEKLTEKKLPKKELASMQRILISIEDLSKKLCESLVEGLRRKNEALKQISKKDRADPLIAMAPSVSPIALNDDSSALNLVVRLGRGQDAASAYATRRSLLLNECLNERPICNTNMSNNADIIIYASQLSHSFFHALSISVEGFLDLFSDAKGGGLLDDQSESSSINTGTSLKSVPSNALAATCLWCDSELLKFASVFGSKVLGNLMLSPREGGTSNKITDKITKFEVVADLSHLKTQLRAAEELGEYVAAGKLRKKIAIQEEEERSGNTDHRAPAVKKSNDKDRTAAIDIASKCIDQAFELSSEFLNSIGLPLTPRLAEYLKTRLNGAEAEIAIELEDKWEHIIFDWKSSLQ